MIDDLLLKEFQPQVIEYEEAGLAEFVIRDCGMVAHYLGNGMSWLQDMDTGECVGVQWQMPKREARSLK